MGFYCWAGPGTIRITNTKFFNPKIDEESFLRSYNLDYLRKIKDIFGVTDMWVTYSWGYAKDTEDEDHNFILSRLKNFRQVGIRTHAYVQGTNLIYEDFRDRDWFCVDDRGKKISYSKGRKVMCVNNPGFRKYQKEKIQEVCQNNFDGVFLDNIQMGKLGIPGGENYSSAFVGCCCRYCDKKFRIRYGRQIPKILKPKTIEREEYLQFRLDSISDFLQEMSVVAYTYKKDFGTNSYDPRFDTTYCYGIDLQKICSLQSYLLFENHSFPDGKEIGNGYIDQLIIEEEFRKPVFVVSYQRGIGFDYEYKQSDINRLFSEGRQSLFFVCLKGSEYITRKVWHNLEVEKYQKPILGDYPIVPLRKRRRRSVFTYPGIDIFFRKYGGALFDWYWNSRVVRKVFSFLYKRIVVK